MREYLESDTNGRKVRDYLDRKSSAPAPRTDAKEYERRIDKRIHALEQRLESPPAPPTNPPINAAGGASGYPVVGSGRKDAEWVKREGVVGYPAPVDRFKPMLYVAKIYSHMGESVDDLPDSSSELVGSKCPGCKQARADVPEGRWYYKPNHPLFASAGEGRVRPVVGKYNDGGPRYEAKTGFMHNAAFCQNVWADVHRWVRAHPEDKWMFDAVPEGENAYARPLRR